MVAASCRRGRSQKQHGVGANNQMIPTWHLPPDGPLVSRQDRGILMLLERAGRSLFAGVTFIVSFVMSILDSARPPAPDQPDGLFSQPATPHCRSSDARVKCVKERMKRVQLPQFKRKTRHLNKSPATAHRSAKHRHLCMRLAVISSDLVPDTTRLSMARRLPHCTQISPKLRACCAAGLLQLLLRAAYSEIRCSSVLRVVRRLSSGILPRPPVFEKTALYVIECAGATTKQLADAFDLLKPSLYSTKDLLRVIDACVSLLARHPDPAEHRDLWFNIVDCIRCSIDWNAERVSAVARVLEHSSNPLALLLDVLERQRDQIGEARDPWNEKLSDTIKSILTRGSEQARVTIAVRYSAQLARAMPKMTAWNLADLARHAEFAVIMVHAPNLLKVLSNGLRERKNETAWEELDLSFVCVRLMGFACDINDSNRLEHMLGMGLLKSASLLAQSDLEEEDEADLNKFTTVLDQHPEWVGYFKEVTRDGYPELAFAAAGFRVSPIVEPTLYILDEREEQEQVPSQNTVPVCPAAVSKREPAALQQEEAEEGGVVATFADLPPHFYVALARLMTFTQMSAFRRSWKQALAAVDHRGRSVRALDIVQIVHDLWPETRAPIDSLYSLSNEMVRLTAWLRLDLINSIDFAGAVTMNVCQLESAFGSRPRPNVKTLNLVGITVMPTVWSALASLFPGVQFVRCTEHTSQFPASIQQEVMLASGEKIGGAVLLDQKVLVKKGVLGEERCTTLRSLKVLFPAAIFLHVE